MTSSLFKITITFRKLLYKNALSLYFHLHMTSSLSCSGKLKILSDLNHHFFSFTCESLNDINKRSSSHNLYSWLRKELPLLWKIYLNSSKAENINACFLCNLQYWKVTSVMKQIKACLGLVGVYLCCVQM